MADSQKYGRTANLYDGQYEPKYYNDNGELTSDPVACHSTTYIPVSDTRTFTISNTWYSAQYQAAFAVYEWDSNKNWIRRSNRQSPTATKTITFTVGNDCAYFTLQIQKDTPDIMVNTGSTALPYQPYYGWVHSLRKMSTATEAVENPLYSDGTAITSYTFKGNTETSGTPTPSAPISVNGVGNKTANLCNPTPYKAGYYISAEGQEVQNNVFDIYSISATANQSYTISANVTLGGNTVRIHSYTNGTWTEQVKAESSGDLPWSFTAPTGCDEIRISITHNAYEHIMVNTGTTALPYEPYGYKIPISSGQTALNPIYLSSQLMKINDTVDSLVSTGTATYNTYKLVLTGDEAWDISLGVFYLGTLSVDYLRSSGNITYMSTHYQPYQQQSSAGSVPDGKFGFGDNSSVQRLYVHDSSYSTVQDFKAFLAAQYANGTPVTICYIRATPTTESVTAPSIPTVDGANSITVDTTVQPSEFTATWTGWHDSSVKEYDGTDWQ